MADLNQEFDVVVVGSGPGGYWAAIRAAQYGLSTLCIEKDPKLGGTCLHVGCIPTKAFLHNAEVMDVFRNAKEMGVDAGPFALNWGQVQARKDQIVAKHAKGIEFLFRKNKVQWMQGVARWAGPGRLEVAAGGGTQEVRARNIIWATGSAARMLPGMAADDRILTNIEILKLPAVPKRLVIIGAGAVGVEFASIFQRFGTEVTILEMLPRLVPVEDEEIARELEKAYRKQKIGIETGARVAGIEKTADGVKVAYTNAAGQEQSVAADAVLIAVGRRPITEGLNLERSGVQFERGFIKTDGYMRTGEPGMYAIGDVVSGTPQLAHVASAEGMVAVAHIAGRPVDPVDYGKIPGVTFCEPQVASVGLTEQAAKQKGLRYKVGKFPFLGNSKATILGAHEGFIKIIADEKDGTVLGVHMIGPMVTELISEAVLGMQLNVAADEIMGTVHAHPTLYEAVLDAANSVYGLTINA
ncbi:MAG: dihydrolipoyl dehydrogenase [Terriglobales bacterium]